MGLQLSATVLGVENRMVEWDGGSPFESRTLHVLDGFNKYGLRIARDFGELPTPGEVVTLEVSVSAYATRSGAAVQMTALRCVNDAQLPARLAAVD